MEKCKNCGNIERLYKLKLIPTNRQDILYPKYIPQIKESCLKCGRFIKFAKQTKELIEYINGIMESGIIGTGQLDF